MSSMFLESIPIQGNKKILIIGAGPAGSSIARVCAESGCHVDLHEKRAHLAGHCFDEKDQHGVLVHRYGPHYFRTDSVELLKWLSRFTGWIPGRYYVRAQVKDKLVALPISLSTISALKEKAFTSEDFENYLTAQRENIPAPKNAEEQCLALIGKELYQALFEGYTIKQWGIHPTQLPASVTARLPLRFNWDERYPTEKFQVMPNEGYTKMFEKMLQHPSIHLKLNSSMDGLTVRKLSKEYDATIYTGPIDELFDYKYGKLGYRSLRFDWKHYKADYVQPCVQINYPNDHDYTRTVEVKHITGQQCQGTTVCFEYPQESGPPFYPLLTADNREIYQKYEAMANDESMKKDSIYLIGRLAEFKYFNMDQVFLRALTLSNTILQKWT